MNFRDKICDWTEAGRRRLEAKRNGNKVVFTNGCFDILHVGHITYLEEARALGDILVVGLNSDASVHRLKGGNRPIKNLDNRAAILAGLASVDLVVEFEEDTPFSLIRHLLPDVLVKGGDYNLEDIVGADVVVENGGEVRSLDFVPGYSSSNIINKMESK